MNKFLKTCSLPKLNIEDIENMIRPVTSNKSESLIQKNCLKKKLPKYKSPEPDWFTRKYFQTFKELMPQIIPKHRRRRKASKYILPGQQYPDTKTR